MLIDQRFDGSKVRWIRGLMDPGGDRSANPNLTLTQHPLDPSTLGSSNPQILQHLDLSPLGSIDTWIY